MGTTYNKEAMKRYGSVSAEDAEHRGSEGGNTPAEAEMTAQ